MNVPELIANVLDNLRRNFYTHDGHVRTHEFKRDERQLIKAVSRYGHECNQRGWQFDCDFIYHDLTQLLLKIRTSGADIKFMPVYLDGAINRHIGQRAEELSARAKAMPTRIANVISGMKPVELIREPSAVEVFSNVFKGINRINRARKTKRDTKERQETLL